MGIKDGIVDVVEILPPTASSRVLLNEGAFAREISGSFKNVSPIQAESLG
jgi:hypothetical protein